MKNIQFSVNRSYSCDVLVVGGGVAGISAAICAARNGASVILIESAGSLGGTLTEGQMPYILDGDNKGGMIREMLDYLNAREQTVVKRGKKLDENGKRIPGYLINVEGAKYFFDEVCRESGVKVLFHSRVAAADHENGHIRSIMLATECGNYSVEAKVYIDATGNGNLAALVGCGWECGDPLEKRPNPASMQAAAVGMPDDYDGIQNVDDKTAYGKMLEEYGISVSSQQVSVVKLPALKLWGFGMNFERPFAYSLKTQIQFPVAGLTQRGQMKFRSIGRESHRDEMFRLVVLRTHSGEAVA
jgi:flavin-dependent dehydrogenase